MFFIINAVALYNTNIEKKKNKKLQKMHNENEV